MKEKMDLINSRIKNIKDPIQKVILQDVLKDVFLEIITYSENKYERFERKIDAEIADDNEKYYVHTAVCKRENMDNTSRFLFEMCDLQSTETEDLLSTIFLACDNSTIKRCMDKTFEATIITEKNNYKTVVKLEYAKRYLNRIEWLYNVFNSNQKLWRTVNCPFIYKFLDVIDVNRLVPRNEKILSCDIQMQELKQFMHTDMVPLWNIQEIDAVAEGITVPGSDVILYEYTNEAQAQMYGYMAYCKDIKNFYCVYNENSIAIRTKEKIYGEVKLLRFGNIDIDKDNTQLFLPIMSNKRTLSHTDRQANSRSIPVFTRGEIERIINQFDMMNKPYLTNTSILNEYEPACLNLNDFMIRHLFLQNKKVLLLTFSANDKKDILLYEKMCFLVSEIQLYFSEYRCVGELV